MQFVIPVLIPPINIGRFLVKNTLSHRFSIQEVLRTMHVHTLFFGSALLDQTVHRAAVAFVFRPGHINFFSKKNVVLPSKIFLGSKKFFFFEKEKK